MKNLLQATIAIAACFAGINGHAQLSTNPDKFLGNITTRGQVNGGGIEFATLWNQLTPENESKWASIEGTRGSYNWGGCDNCYNYCTKNNIPFKFHTLVWGSQYPSWMDDLSTSSQYKAVEKWMDAVKEHYPSLDMIDVVNEAINGHAPAPFKNALGGDGVTGIDWIIKAFEMARERWPEAILIYNDYNTFLWQKNEFIDLVRTLRDAGAPIDAYGCQSHDLTDMDFTTFKNSMQEIQTELQMPMYSTEYDIGTADDQKQLKQYRDQIKYMWESDYVAGITLWGYIYGSTWVTDGNSGIIKNGVDRPAMEWLREYMASDAAKTAKSPFPNFKKEASIYVKPSAYQAEIEKEMTITVDATLHCDDAISQVELYLDNKLVSTFTEEPYEYEYTPAKVGSYKLKAIVTTEGGRTFERLGGFKAHVPQTPYNDCIAVVPGTIEAEEFDCGGEGISWHDSDTKDEGKSGFRTDNQGVDIGVGGTGYVIGYTATGEWLEYTVDVTQAGKYDFEVIASAGMDGAACSLGLVTDEGITSLTKTIKIPNNSTWDVYSSQKAHLSKELQAGVQTLRLIIEGSYCNIDKFSLILRGSADVSDAIAPESSTYDVYTTTGVCLGRIDDASQLRQIVPSKGIYLLRNVATGNTTKAVVAYE